MSGYWDPTDPKYVWSIEKELEEMISRGRMRSYDRLYKGSVEEVKLHSDGSADVNVYGKDENDTTGHWHFVIKFDSSGRITEVKIAIAGKPSHSTIFSPTIMVGLFLEFLNSVNPTSPPTS